MTQGLLCLWLLDVIMMSAVSAISDLCDPTKHAGSLMNDEEDLYHKIFRDYNPLIRPVINMSQTITVQFNLALSQIVSVDEKNQIMKTNVWLQMYWKDYQLVWDPKDYGDISALRIRPEKTWTPDIVLFNNADGNYEVSYRSNVIVYHDGNVNWIPPAIYKSSCTIDVEFFPFDEQDCHMKFGSWTFRENQLNFTFFRNMNSLDVTDYLKSGTWDILDSPAKITREQQPGSNEMKTMVIFKFKLRRKTLFYTVNLIIPCVLISFVTLCVFALPADAGEKITLCISILLALVVFLLLISKILPPSVTIPLVAKYLLFTFVMNIAAICLTVIVINRNFRTPRTHQMPYWVRLIFLYYLPKLLFMERPDHEDRWRAPEDEEESRPFAPPIMYTSQVADISSLSPTRRRQTEGEESMDSGDVHHPNCRLTPSPRHGRTNPRVIMYDDTHYMQQLSPDIVKAAEALRFISKHLQHENDYNTVLDDWKYVARVIDRLLLYIFLIVTVMGTAGLLMQAPHILQYVDQDEIIQDIIRKWNKN